jgi:pimeloyl-ACP methyl ester carboxylesterase
VPTTPVEVDVSAAVPFPGHSVVRGWVHAPDRPPPPGSPVVVACCLAGGTCSTRYFDLEVEGLAGYSMAAHLARHGFVTIALDHLGIGESDRVDDVFRLTPPIVSAANDLAHREVLATLARGTLPLDGWSDQISPIVIGLGHSMGGMLATVQQARHRTFDAVVVLGHGGDGLPEVLTPDEAAVTGDLDDIVGSIEALARQRFARPSSERRGLVPGSFLAADVPDAVRTAFVNQQTSLLFSCGLTSMIPGATDVEKAAITVPLFLGFGEYDLTTDFAGSVAHYRSARDITLFVVPGSAHCHNQAGNRALLWDRIASWANALTATDAAATARVPQESR